MKELMLCVFLIGTWGEGRPKVFDASEITQIQNFSGFSRIYFKGNSWVKIEPELPTGQMQRLMECATRDLRPAPPDSQ